MSVMAALSSVVLGYLLHQSCQSRRCRRDARNTRLERPNCRLISANDSTNKCLLSVSAPRLGLLPTLGLVVQLGCEKQTNFKSSSQAYLNKTHGLQKSYVQIGFLSILIFFCLTQKLVNTGLFSVSYSKVFFSSLHRRPQRLFFRLIYFCIQ